MIAIPPFIIGGIAFCNNNSEKEYTNVSFLENQLLPENTATDGTKSPILLITTILQSCIIHVFYLCRCS